MICNRLLSIQKDDTNIKITEAYLETCQTSMIELFARTVKKVAKRSVNHFFKKVHYK